MFRRPVEDLLVQEKQVGEGLILGNSGGVSASGEAGKKLFDRVIAEHIGMRHLVKADVSPDPPDIRLVQFESCNA
jgi:hypothetical protein